MDFTKVQLGKLSIVLGFLAYRNIDEGLLTGAKIMTTASSPKCLAWMTAQKLLIWGTVKSLLGAHQVGEGPSRDLDALNFFQAARLVSVFSMQLGQSQSSLCSLTCLFLGRVDAKRIS